MPEGIQSLYIFQIFFFQVKPVYAGDVDAGRQMTCELTGPMKTSTADIEDIGCIMQLPSGGHEFHKIRIVPVIAVVCEIRGKVRLMFCFHLYARFCVIVNRTPEPFYSKACRPVSGKVRLSRFPVRKGRRCMLANRYFKIKGRIVSKYCRDVPADGRRAA